MRWGGIEGAMPPRKAAKKRPASRAAKRGPDLARVEKDLAELRAKTAVLFAALGLPEAARRGDRGSVGDLNEAVLKIQDYLLRTSERIDHMLSTLKNHRELLVKMNQRMYNVGTRERIRMQLDILKNTASVLAMNGIELEDALLQEIEKVRRSSEKDDVDVADLRKAKEAVDKRFDTAVSKFDLSAIYKPRGRALPGYR